MTMVSCVGTVESGITKTTKSKKKADDNLNFKGAQQAVAIADDKIDVFFYPAQGGSKKYRYLIYYGGEPDPIEVTSDTLDPKKDYRGLLKYTISDLQRATNYPIQIDVIDDKTDKVTENNKYVDATTFSNLVADFFGVTQVSNVPGIDGMDSIKVRWTHATVDAGNIFGSDKDPEAYEIIVTEADKLTPGDMDNNSLNQAQGRYIKILDYESTITEAVVRGLPSGTRFYVKVRAIHEGSVEDFNKPYLRSELNSNYLELSTLSSDLAEIDFDTTSLELSLGAGAAASSSIQAVWDEANGLFDHYRLYYAEDGVSLNAVTLTEACNGSGQSVNDIYCKKLEYTKSDTMIANLKTSTKYNLILVVCQSIECESGKRILGDTESISTIPKVPSFSGIKTITQAKNINEVGTLYLNFSLPDFDDGFFDGYIIDFKTSSDSAAEYDEITEEDYDGNIGAKEYNYLTDSTIQVEGITYDGSTHCFNIYPFLYLSDGSKDKTLRGTGKWKCINPEVVGPTLSQFQGITEARTTGNDVTISWNNPTSGVYTEYEIFYRKKSGAFLFEEAIQDTTVDYDNEDYERVVINVDADSPNTTIRNLPELAGGGSYKFGMITHYLSADGVIRSEENPSAVFICELEDDEDVICYSN